MNQNDYIKHYGILGQKWGIRRFQNPDGTLTVAGKMRYGGVYDRNDGTKDTKRLKKDAEADAKEYARAKAYYGEGAGNRRKQIKNKISERMKDPDYKAEFESQLKNQDMSKHQKAANRERHVQDAKDKTKRVANGVKNLILGVGTTSLTAIALYTVAKNLHIGDTIARFAKTKLRTVFNAVQNASSKRSPLDVRRRVF